MKRSNTVLLTLACLSLVGCSSGQELRWDFDSDLGDLVSNRGIWQWSDRGSLQWQVPDGAEGFALLSNAGEGDELYDAIVDIQHGLTYEIRIFVSSQYEASTTFQVQQLALDGSFVQIIDDYTSLSSPTNDEWLTVSGSLEPSDTPSRFGVFCESPESNSEGESLWGCAIDYIAINVSPEATTDPGPSAPQTEGPTIAVLPGGIFQWMFENDTDGWMLGRSNGAAWQRLPIDFESISSSRFSHALHVIPTDVYSGTVLAMSPRLVVGSTGTVVVYAEFFMNATADYPVYLKLRRRLSYEEYDQEPLLNLDSYGNQENQQWNFKIGVAENLTPGEEFNLVFEGNLGIDNTRSSIAVSTILIEGVSQIPFEEEEFFLFSDGLVGWQAGSMDGGKWIVTPYSDLNSSLFIPQPDTDDILMLDRFDIHSGVITIESPPIPIEPVTSKSLNLRFWIRGSVDYPVLLRLSLKTLDGVYDEEPFVDLKQYGDSNMLQWMNLEGSFPIPTQPRAEFFQIVIEVDCGADISNMVAIESILLFTHR